ELAYLDRHFLESEDARPLRILAEYFKPLQVFRRERIRETVVFFGSARVREEGPLGHYYAQARELARLVTEWSKSLPAKSRRFIVCSGGGPGIMEAANRGASDARGLTIGLNIGLPNEQRPNPYITRELCLEFRYFFMRKLWFTYPARAFVAFPGGFGTLDELMEVLTLSQTCKLARKIPVLLFGSSYWKEIIDFEALVRHGMISPEDLQLFHYVDDPQSALLLLQRELSLVPTGPAPTPALATSVTPAESAPAQGGWPRPDEGRSSTRVASSKVGGARLVFPAAGFPRFWRASRSHRNDGARIRPKTRVAKPREIPRPVG